MKKIIRYYPQLIEIPAVDISSKNKEIDLSKYANDDNLSFLRLTNFTNLTIKLDIIELYNNIAIPPRCSTIIDFKIDEYRSWILKEKALYKKLREHHDIPGHDKSLALVFVFKELIPEIKPKIKPIIPPSLPAGYQHMTYKEFALHIKEKLQSGECEHEMD